MSDHREATVHHQPKADGFIDVWTYVCDCGHQVMADSAVGGLAIWLAHKERAH